MVILMFHLRHPASGILLSSVTWTNSLGRCSCSSLGEAMRSAAWLVSFLQRGGSQETVNNYSLQCNSIGSGYPGTYSKLATNVNNESLTSGNVAVGGHPRQMIEIPWTPNSRGNPNHKLQPYLHTKNVPEMSRGMILQAAATPRGNPSIYIYRQFCPTAP